MKLFNLLIILILFSNNVFALTVINEIMYNPQGNDNNREFVEIYSDENINFSNYIIEDSTSNDLLKQVKYVPGYYSLIVEDGFDYSNLNASVYIAGNTIGNNLNNDNDVIILRNNESKIIDVVSYSNDFGANDNGKSLERISLNDFSNNINNWKESNLDGGTPGYNNTILNINFKDLIINEFLPDPSGNDDANMPNGEWIEIYNNLDHDINLEGFILEDDFGHKLIITNTNTVSIIIKGNDFIVVYANGVSGFLNNDGLERIKLFYGNKLIDEVSYSNSKESLSWSKINDGWKLLSPSPLNQNIDEFNLDKGTSSIRISKVYLGTDNKARFGDQFEVRLEIYKGNTTKNAINVWAEKDDKKISRVSNFNIYGKFSNYTINIPILLDNNCNEKYTNGYYELIVEGLDNSDKEKINVEGIDNSLCNKKVETKKAETNIINEVKNQEPKSEEELHIASESLVNNIQGKVVYESSDIKARGLSYYILVFTLLFIIILILFRKGL